MQLLTNVMLQTIQIAMKDPGLPLRKNDIPPVMSFEHLTKMWQLSVYFMS
jgi:hypothetical protein